MTYKIGDCVEWWNGEYWRGRVAAVSGDCYHVVNVYKNCQDGFWRDAALDPWDVIPEEQILGRVLNGVVVKEGE